MAKKTTAPIPSVQRLLRTMGANIRLARLRRKLSASQIAERAGITRPTLAAIEKGKPTVSMGAYANVLHCLGLHLDLGLLASDDELGRKLQDAQLEKPRRGARSK